MSVSALSWNAYQINEKTKAKLLKTTSKFYKDVLSGKLHSPSWLILIPYNLFRGMSLAYRKGTEFQTEDGVYWLEESRKHGVYESSVHVPFYKKPFGQLFYAIGKFAGKKTMVTYKK